jgi:hypothetical protein
VGSIGTPPISQRCSRPLCATTMLTQPRRPVSPCSVASGSVLNKAKDKRSWHRSRKDPRQVKIVGDVQRGRIVLIDVHETDRGAWRRKRQSAGRAGRTREQPGDALMRSAAQSNRPSRLLHRVSVGKPQLQYWHQVAPVDALCLLPHRGQPLWTAVQTVAPLAQRQQPPGVRRLLRRAAFVPGSALHRAAGREYRGSWRGPPRCIVAALHGNAVQ